MLLAKAFVSLWDWHTEMRWVSSALIVEKEKYLRVLLKNQWFIQN